MKKKDGQTMIGFWLPVELADALTEECWQSRTTKSEFIRQAITKQIQENQKERE